MAERIKGWRATDGSEHPTAAEADRHDAEIALAAWFADVLKEKMDGRDMSEWLAERIRLEPMMFRAIVWPLISGRRKRKASAAPAKKRGGKAAVQATEASGG